MKKITAIFIVLSLSLMVCSPASAEEEMLNIFVNEEKLDLALSPIVENGTSFIQARTLLEALDYELTWEATEQKVTATNEENTLHMWVERQTAQWNNEQMELLWSPKLVDGYVYIPLRWVAELVGYEVLWDDETQSIKMNEMAWMEAQVKEVLEQTFADFAKEDAEAVLRHFADYTPLYFSLSASLEEKFKHYDINSTIEYMDFIQMKDGEAVVHTTINNVNTNDAFYLDNKSEIVYFIVQNDKGTWEIVNEELKDVTFTNLEALVTNPPKYRSSLKRKVTDVIENNVKASEDEDIEAFMDTIHEQAPTYDMLEQQAKFMFATYDLKYSLEENVLVYVDEDEGEAYVYTVSTTSKLDGPPFTDARTKAILVLQKNEENEWKIVSTTPITTEAIK
ncbi:copper amine oxidase N-terminal domain-containing protein [Longirhabdus pacifica]|uniref:copper amine oxidase N-terminal domain-containing protein n=1 Tax=Longirhabdus pacifica TaxID=2305227 RepID=UPI00100891B0|nr:copper amine oxidase N-terminal domain-containing protein [Longirhabdus pacifica]